MAVTRNIRKTLGLLTACVGLFTPLAAPRALTITPEYTSAISPRAQAVINQAIAFYNTTFNGSNLALTMTFGSQSNGGATSWKSNFILQWSEVRQAVINSQSASAVDASAIANLPVTLSTATVLVPVPLVAALGLRIPNGSNFSINSAGCSSTMVFGCNTFSNDLLSGGANNGPNNALLAVAQHEINEVLGTSSGAGGSTAGIADAFRYASAGTLGFGVNPGSGGQSCAAGTPIASLSIDGGKTPLVNYNNCGNGGDYGDFVVNNPTLVQDWASAPDTNTAGLTTTSPEVQLLDAIGWNLTAPLQSGSAALAGTGTATQAGTSSTVIDGDYNLANGGLTDPQFNQVEHDDVLRFPDRYDTAAGVPVPEPGTLALIISPVALAFLNRRRRPVAG